MNKAEELKLRAVLKKLSDIDIEFSTADLLYRNDEGEKPKSGDYYKRKIEAIKLYADEQGREFSIWLDGGNAETPYNPQETETENYNRWVNEWKSNQEGER